MTVRPKSASAKYSAGENRRVISASGTTSRIRKMTLTSPPMVPVTSEMPSALPVLPYWCRA